MKTLLLLRLKLALAKVTLAQARSIATEANMHGLVGFIGAAEHVTETAEDVISKALREAVQELHPSKAHPSTT